MYLTADLDYKMILFSIQYHHSEQSPRATAAYYSTPFPMDTKGQNKNVPKPDQSSGLSHSAGVSTHKEFLAEVQTRECTVLARGSLSQFVRKSWLLRALTESLSWSVVERAPVHTSK